MIMFWKPQNLSVFYFVCTISQLNESGGFHLRDLLKFDFTNFILLYGLNHFKYFFIIV